MARWVQVPAARRYFIIHYAYLTGKAGIDTAKQFRQAVELTYAELAGKPRIGAPHKVRGGKHAGIRLCRVRDFKEYLIAYRPYRGGIRIERIVHAKQDYRRVLK